LPKKQQRKQQRKPLEEKDKLIEKSNGSNKAIAFLLKII